MSYSTSNPPKLLTPSFDNTANTCATWSYVSTDGASTVDASGYITNGGDLGMKVGDLVYVTDSDASPVVTTIHRVVSVSSTAPGAVDLADGVTVGSTNSD